MLRRPSPADPDLLSGCDEIARFLRLSSRTVNGLLKSGKIPATQLGTRWTSSKSRLSEWLAQEFEKNLAR